MKKALSMVLALFLFLANTTAESDLHITTALFSFFDVMSASWDGSTHSQNHVFVGGNELVRVKNYNFPHSQKYGFYEMVALTGMPSVSKDSYGDYERYLGFLAAVGGAMKIYETEKTLVATSLGAHITLKESDDVFVLGAESDLYVKFTKNRLFSPVIGMTANFDFYTNEKGKTYYKYTWTESDWEYRETRYNEYTLDSFWRFYVIPYVSFCINF